jgi:dTDP-4-amino-4,6-dideoxygalactose transaminase
MAIKMEFNDLNIRSRKYRNEIKKLIDKVINSNRCFNGPENKKLEKNLQCFLKGGLITNVASGHDAILLSFLALKLKKEDEVIFPVNSYPTIFPIVQVNAKAVPCDVDENGLIDPKEIDKKITKNTRVIIITHLYGLVCNIDEIKKIIVGKNITLVEDCAQAFGSQYKNKSVGTLGDIGCFSFYPTKNLGTLGDGGAIWTKNKDIYDFIIMAKSYGELKRYYSLFPSGHSRIPEIQAGILNIYFNNIKKELDSRIELAKYFTKKIDKTKLIDYIRPLNNDSHQSPLHLFVVETKKRNELQKYLNGKGIPTFIHYPYPVHLVQAFFYLGYKSGDFPIAERLAKNILGLPFYPMMTKKQVDYIVNMIKKFYL